MKTCILCILLLLQLSVSTVDAKEPTRWEELPPDLQQSLIEFGKEEIKRDKLIQQGVQDWLLLLDQHKYRDAVTMIGEMMTWNNKEYTQYYHDLKKTHLALGEVKSRKQISITYGKSELSRVITYETQYQNRKVTEVITASLSDLLPIDIYSYKITSNDGKLKYSIPPSKKHH